MSGKEIYNDGFYQDAVHGSLTAARVVLPLLFQGWRPETIVDIGCGLGAWCATAGQLGVAQCTGLDGAHVSPESLLIPAAAFIAHDLEAELPANLSAELAICIEVAEHLTSHRAEGLVADLCRIAPVILFSAAVPFQGGSGHVNENWPEYWAAMFARYGFFAHDCLRDKVWGDMRIPWWYRQNLLVFARPEMAGIVPALGAVAEAGSLAKIHPEMFMTAVHRRRLMTGRNINEDLHCYRQAVAGAGYAAGYGTEFDIVFQ